MSADDSEVQRPVAVRRARRQEGDKAVYFWATSVPDNCGIKPACGRERACCISVVIGFSLAVPEAVTLLEQIVVDQDCLAAQEPMSWVPELLMVPVLLMGQGLEPVPDRSFDCQGMVQVLEATRNRDHWRSASDQRVFQQIDLDHPNMPSIDRHRGRFQSGSVLSAYWGG